MLLVSLMIMQSGATGPQQSNTLYSNLRHTCTPSKRSALHLMHVDASNRRGYCNILNACPRQHRYKHYKILYFVLQDQSQSCCCSLRALCLRGTHLGLKISPSCQPPSCHSIKGEVTLTGREPLQLKQGQQGYLT